MARTSVALKGAGMKSRSEIWLSALDELGAQCSVDTTRDAISVTRRIESEGDAFFTKTLPTFAKDLERSLELGSLQPEMFKGWQRNHLTLLVRASEQDGDDVSSRAVDIPRHGLPKFLGGFMSIIFNPVLELSNYLYESSIVDGFAVVPPMRCTSDAVTISQMATAIRAIRQLCLMFSKERDLCSDDLITEAIGRYVELDMDLMRPLPMTVGTLYFRAAPSIW